MFALDANAIIHAFQGKGKVEARLAAVSPSRIAIPSIALFEVECGVRRSANAGAAENAIRRIGGRPPRAPHRRTHGRHRSNAQARTCNGRLKIGPMDTLIAATALAHGAKLVTNNTREFERVPGLQLEDWFHDS